MRYALAGLLALTTLGAADRVTIDVNPRVLFAGGAIRVRCRVPRHPDNRSLTMVLSNYTSHEVPLDGEAAPVTHQFIFEHVPCETDLAACVVEDNLHRQATASLPVSVQCSERRP